MRSRLPHPLRRVVKLPRRPVFDVACRTLSYVAGSTAEPLDERTLAQAWRHAVRDHGDRPALVSRHELGEERGDCLRWTYARFDMDIEKLARGLRAIGIQKGDRVASWQGNSSANATLFQAAARIGAILVPLNPAYRADELQSALSLVEAKALFGVPRLRSSDYASMLAGLLPSLSSSKPHQLQDAVLPALRSVVFDDNLPYEQQGAFGRLLEQHGGIADYQSLLHMSSSPLPHIDLDREETINVQFTSGTTAAPKAVMLTHRNLLNNGLHIGGRMKITSQDVLLNTPPLFHCFGLVLGNLALWTHGGCVVYASELFDAKATVEAITAERATALHGVPTMFIRILEEIDRLQAAGQPIDTSLLRTGIAAGSTVPAPLMTRLTSPEGLNLKELTIVFGQTESSPGSFQSRTDDPLQKRIETVGKVMPHVEAKVVDPVTGETLPRGQTGELYVSGYVLFKGYLGDAAATQKTIEVDANGKCWLKTGDLASLDEDDFLSIRGRTKDLIIRGGENLAAPLIEDVLLSHPSVADAAAVSVPDPLLGEAVGVFVRPRNTIDRQALRAHVKAAMPQAAPSWIFVMGQDAPADWPMTTSGKIRKVELRVLAAQLAAQGIGRVEVA